MKQKFDALTDLVEHAQQAAPEQPAESAKVRQVQNTQGETIVLNDKKRPQIF